MMRFNNRKARSNGAGAVILMALSTPALALHIVPDHLDDSHFTSGPCPVVTPPDGASCPAGAATCPAFYDPKILPAGFNSVSYCATISALSFGATGFTLRTTALTAEERRSFLRAARRAESYVKDDVTVVIEPYKVAFLDSTGTNIAHILGNEYWNPVCAADALMPPFVDKAPTIVENADGSHSYADLPETYTPVLNALKRKNASNDTPATLTDHLPTHDQINVEWPATFFGWQAASNLVSDEAQNYLVGTSGNYPITPGAKPFTLCASPATMKMLGFARSFHRNGHDIDELNAPRYNINVTLPGTDGALVVADLSDFVSPGSFDPSTYIYDPDDPEIVETQLPAAYFTKSLNLALPNTACADPTKCQFPLGVNPGLDLTGIFNHEINHVLGIMESEYYKGAMEGTALAYGYGTALFLLDLFDLDSDYVVSGFEHPGIHSAADFTTVPRNNDTFTPITTLVAPTAAGLSPWIQFGAQDHLLVYDLRDESPRYFPLQNYSEGNPDGDIAVPAGRVFPNATSGRYVLLDPELLALDPLDVLHPNVQAAVIPGTTLVDTIREYSELAVQGWNIDYSTLKKRHSRSPLARWYETCFDTNGVFTVAKNKNCKFSVTPADLKFLRE